MIVKFTFLMQLKLVMPDKAWRVYRQPTVTVGGLERFYAIKSRYFLFSFGGAHANISQIGMAQAEALGTSLRNTKFTAIHSSPLKRALMTAQALLKFQHDPKLMLITSPLLREQHYGLGEGKRYDVKRDPNLSLADHFARGEFPWLQSRTERFPGGESVEDVAKRAEEAIEEILLPYVWAAAKEETPEIHVAIVSHGLFIREAIAVLMKKVSGRARTNPQDYRGLQNTGYTKVAIKVNPKDEKGRIGHMHMWIIEHNCHEHLTDLVRQKGGIGSAAYDPKQRDIRKFFKSGETKSK